MQPRSSAEVSSRTPASSSRVIVPALVALVSVLISYVVVVTINESALPDPDNYSPSKTMPFNLTNALRHIEYLGRKRRTVSSVALEDALRYIAAEMNALRLTALQNNYVMDIQTFRSTPGSFHTNVGPLNILHAYDNIPSVVVRVRPHYIEKNAKIPTLLVNAHVDSALGSPGVSDNLSGVGLCMDIIRAIVSTSSDYFRLKRPVVFLFNGAEETVLPGAHSFITQHRWGRAAAAHINLESIGAGNTYYLFQLGPNAPWLARAYANAVSVPYGTIAAADVFSTKLIPATTDFAVFDSFGGIPGFDFALHDNGYIYHTKYDDFDHLSRVGVLHGGITVFELIMELAGKTDAIGAHVSGNDPINYVENVARNVLSKMHLTDFSGNNNIVFFDLLHRVAVVFDENAATLFYVLVLFSTSSVWIIKTIRWTKYDWTSFLRMIFILPSCFFASFASPTFGSFVYSELLGLKLAWYGSMEKALVIFVPHVLFGLASMLLFLVPRKLPVNRFDHMLLVTTVYFLIMATIFMRRKIMSAYLPLFMLIILSICAMQGRRVPALLRHLQIVTVVAVFTASQTKSTLAVTLPIMGFARTDAMPHDTIAALIVAYCCLNYVVIPCLPILCEYAAALRRLVRILLATSLFVAFYFLLLEDNFSDDGRKSSFLSLKTSSNKRNPYSKEAPKRLTVVHFHSPNMTPSSVLMLARHDAIKADEKRLLSPLFSSDVEVASLPTEPKFGLLEGTPMESFYLYASKVQSKTFLKTSRAPILSVPTLQKTTEVQIAQSWNVSYIMRGSDSHVMSLRFAMGKKSVVKGWSFNFGAAAAQDMAWIRFDGSESFSFWLLLRSNDERHDSPPEVTFMVSSARYGASRSQDDLCKLNFKSWESPAVMVSSAVEYTL